MRPNKKFIVTLAILVVVNLVFFKVDYRWDLSSDGRFSLSDEAVEAIRSIDNEVVVTVLMDGNIPSDLRAYREYVDVFLWQVRRASSKVNVVYRDPSEGTVEEVNAFRDFLRSRGVTPVGQRVATRDQVSQSLIYPYVSVHNARHVAFIDLLTSADLNEDASTGIISSMAAFESRLVRAIRDVSLREPVNVAIVGVADTLLYRTFGMGAKEMSAYAFFSRNELALDDADIVLALDSREGLDRHDLLYIDQAVVRDVPIVWYVDRFDVEVDSIRKYGAYTTIASARLSDDMLFKWGVRVRPELVMDLNCSSIPQVVGEVNGQPRIVPIGFPFHPVIQSLPLYVDDPASTYFVSPIDTLRTSDQIRKKPLLVSSPYTRTLSSPVQLSFDFMRVEPDPQEYKDGELVLGVALEGSFSSHFQNRLSSNDRLYLDSLNYAYQKGPGKTRQVIISDTDLILPVNDVRGNRMPLGFNKWERIIYPGNGKILANSLEYALHGDRILSLYRADFSISPFDKGKYRSNRWFYITQAAGWPTLGILLFFIIFRLYRGYGFGKI